METRNQIKQFIETELLVADGDVDLAYDEDLLMSGMVNSLGVMRLVSYTSEAFGIEIPPEDITMENFVSIEALATYLQANS